MRNHTFSAILSPLLALLLAQLGCRRPPTRELVTATPDDARAADAATLDTPAPSPPDAKPAPAEACPPSELPTRTRRARDAMNRAGALSSKGDWKRAIEAYSVATEELALCHDVDELLARAFAERGYANLKAGDLPGAAVDSDRALSMSTDESLLGAASYNVGLVAARESRAVQARDSFARSYAYRPTAAARSALESARTKGRSVSTELAAERYDSIEAACSALGGEDCTSAATATTALCGASATFPCVFQSSRAHGDDWPEPGEGGPYGAAAAAYVLDRDAGSVVWAYPAGSHTTCWRCGGCGGWVAHVTEDGKLLVVTVAGSTGSGTSRHYTGVGPMGCGPGLDIDQIAILSRARHQTAILVVDAVEAPEP